MTKRPMPLTLRSIQLLAIWSFRQTKSFIINNNNLISRWTPLCMSRLSPIKKALATVRNKKKELKDLDNHALESDNETGNNVLEALEQVNELEDVLDQTKESMYKLSYVVRVSASNLDELKQRCNEVKDFYDDLNVKLIRPFGDMLGLHSEFIPASKRYMNDYIQYVTSDFLAGLGFGATQMLGENEGIYFGYNLDTGRNVYLNPSLASQGVKGSVTNALASAFLGSLGGGKSFSNNLLVYYAVLYGGQALVVDPKSERGGWKKKPYPILQRKLISLIYPVTKPIKVCSIPM